MPDGFACGIEGQRLFDRLVDGQPAFTHFHFHVSADLEAGVPQPAAAEAEARDFDAR